MENIEYDWEERNKGNSLNLPLNIRFIIHIATRPLSNSLITWEHKVYKKSFVSILVTLISKFIITLLTNINTNIFV